MALVFGSALRCGELSDGVLKYKEARNGLLGEPQCVGELQATSGPTGPARLDLDEAGGPSRIEVAGSAATLAGKLNQEVPAELVVVGPVCDQAGRLAGRFE